MPKKVFALSLSFIFLMTAVCSSAQPLLLEPLLEEAKKNNPEILAAARRYDAAKARIPQAKSPDDPVIGIGFQYTPGSPFQLKKTPSNERMLSISQALPFFGKLSLRGKIALVESQMSASEYKNKELEIASEVKNAYYGLFLNFKQIELKEESLKLLQEISVSSEAKYIVAEAEQEEVLKIHSEIAALANNIANLKEEQKAKKTRLNLLLNRGPEGELGEPQLNEKIAFRQDINHLYKLALENQPELLVFSYAIQKNKYAKDLAKKSFFPDLMLGLAMRGITTGTIGPWDLMMAFTLPIWFWTKQRYQVKEAIASLDEAKAAYEAMKNNFLSAIKDLAAKIEADKNSIAMYKDTQIPILESSIASSLAGYRSGKGDFMLLLDSQRMLLEAKMEYYEALADYHMNLAELERAVGSDLREVADEK